MRYIRRNHSVRIPPQSFAVGHTLAGGDPVPGTPILEYRAGDCAIASIDRIGPALEVGPVVEWILATRHPRGSTIWVYSNDLLSLFAVEGVWRAIDEGRLTLQSPERRRGDRVYRARRGTLAIDGPPWTVDLFCGQQRFRFLDIRNYARDYAPAGDSAESHAVGIAATVAGWYRAWVERDQGVWGHTATGLASASWRHTIAIPPIPLHKTDDPFDVPRPVTIVAPQPMTSDCGWGQIFERLAFVGGKNWVGKYGFTRGPVYHLDVSSCYPWAMASYPLPVRWMRTIQSPSAEVVRAWVDSAWCIADGSWDTGLSTYPVKMAANAGGDVIAVDPKTHAPLGVKQTRTYWACGVFSATLCGGELRRAVHSGHMHLCTRLQVYQVGYPVAEFAKKWLSIREQSRLLGDSGAESLAKLVANSLYGWFGRRSRKWRERDDVHPLADWGLWLHFHPGTLPPEKCRAIGGRVSSQESPREREGAMVFLSAGIAEAARTWVRRYVDLLPANTLIGQWTDGLLVNQEGYDALESVIESRRGVPGALRRVGTYSEVEIWSAHHYRLDDRTIRTGVPSDWTTGADNVACGTEAIRGDGIIDPNVRTVRRRTLRKSSIDRKHQISRPNEFGFEVPFAWSRSNDNQSD